MEAAVFGKLLGDHTVGVCLHTVPLSVPTKENNRILRKVLASTFLCAAEHSTYQGWREQSSTAAWRGDWNHTNTSPANVTRHAFRPRRPQPHRQLAGPPRTRTCCARLFFSRSVMRSSNLMSITHVYGVQPIASAHLAEYVVPAGWRAVGFSLRCAQGNTVRISCGLVGPAMAG